MRRLSLLLLALLALTSLRAQNANTAPKNRNFETTKMLDIFNAAYRDLELFYVDSLDAKKTIGDALNYMLSRLDPYNEFYEEEGVKELRTMTTGKYAGIGSPIRYNKKSDRCVFAAPYPNMPAYKGGVRTGDVLLRIDGTDVPPCGKTDKQRYLADVTSRLRGQAGTELLLLVERGEDRKRLTLRLRRENIKLPSVVYSGLCAPNVGYIMLNSYIEESANEVRTAVEQLKSQGAKSLVIDLRSNGGGLMNEAVEMVNLFVPKGKTVLETKGKDPANCYTQTTTADALDTEIPLAILVDGHTASAAEITSGALQDYDRAVILGQRSFGKGLVQSPRPLDYNTVLKITVAKYYIPSGRCVQALDYSHRDTDGRPRHLPDSLCKTFYTAGGRPVKDGGGITPDVALPTDTLPSFIGYLSNSDVLFDFVTAYAQQHKTIASPRDFELSAADWENFKNTLAKSDFTYDRQTLKSLESVRALAKFEGYDQSTKAEFDALAAKLSHRLTDDISRWEREVKDVVETAIVDVYYGASGVIEYRLRRDKDLRAAIDLLRDNARYRTLLSK